MSVFSSILRKIFPPSHPAVVGSADAAAGSAVKVPPAPGPAVDVEEVLSGLANKNQQRLNWRTSIVDLMKLLGLDSSLDSRKTLAGELQYSGDMNDSAGMNMWLHKQVMKKLADNGGKVPAEMKN